MIRSVFAAEGLPLSLAYIPLVESAFKPTAASRVSARGMWQFMLPTAKEHGLQQDWFIDERSDPEKATRAAAQYLKTVIAMFDGDWALALASYNAGPGRIMGAMKKSKSTDFWKITSTSRYLPRETREYVPMIMASMIIAGNPELYGFEVVSTAPLAYETVDVPGAIDLKIIAEWADITVEELQALNPDLRRTTTPMREHPLRVPIGTAATIQEELKDADPTMFRTFRFHTVQSKETLASIAKKYKVSTTSLRELNDLSPTARVRAKQMLAIPEPSANALPAPAATPAVRQTASASAPLVYRVRAGDTLFGIAQRFGTTVDALRTLNKLKSDSITVGLTLTIRR
jgi:membrane-bound lytic murein transglycosylase D